MSFQLNSSGSNTLVGAENDNESDVGDVANVNGVCSAIGSLLLFESSNDNTFLDNTSIESDDADTDDRDLFVGGNNNGSGSSFH